MTGVIGETAVVFQGAGILGFLVLLGLGRLQVVISPRKQPSQPREPGTGKFAAERPSLRETP